MKNQALFSLKDRSKKLKCRLLQFLFGSLRVKNSILKSQILFPLGYLLQLRCFGAGLMIKRANV